jgi:aspartyl-tRNA(Asn)/glutamyl-tRNA(Gln) amidotransferase subunit A
MTDLTKLGVAAIRSGVVSGDFTAVEVAEAFNANVAAAKVLNAFIVETPEKAVEAAKAVDGHDGRCADWHDGFVRDRRRANDRGEPYS